MKLLHTLLIILALCIVAFVTALFVFNMPAPVQTNNATIIKNFQECVAAGYPILESYPEQCKTDDGQTFVNTIPQTTAEFNKSIILEVNKAATFSDGLRITLRKIDDSRCKEGVVCVWAGELSLTFTLEFDSNSKEVVLGTGQIQEKAALGYVVSLQSATETSGTIVVTKEIKRQSGNCYIGGCSGQLCTDQQDMVSTCEYKAEYACYQTAMCQRQANGQCGWSQTAELKACLESK